MLLVFYAVETRPFRCWHTCGPWITFGAGAGSSNSQKIPVTPFVSTQISSMLNTFNKTEFCLIVLFLTINELEKWYTNIMQNRLLMNQAQN